MSQRFEMRLIDEHISQESGELIEFHFEDLQIRLSPR